MEPLELIIVLLCVLLGLGRGADLAFATDAATGLCTAGAVWWRYLALGAVVLAAVLEVLSASRSAVNGETRKG